MDQPHYWEPFGELVVGIPAEKHEFKNVMTILWVGKPCFFNVKHFQSQRLKQMCLTWMILS